MADELSDRLKLPLMHAGQAQKEIVHNEALTVLDMMVQARAVSADLTAPPTAPAPGQCWIVAPGATGAWSGRGGAIAGWTAGGWRFVAAVEGMRLRVSDRACDMLFAAGAWGDAPIRSDGYYQGGVRVVSARQAAIPAPAGGGMVDAEARVAIDQILAALRAHGLIETG
jgi:hypothetical protein